MKKTRQEKIDKAISLYENFTGHEARFIDTVTLPIDTVASAIGHCVGVMYEATRDGETHTYLHKFKKGSRPVLAVSSDGEQLYLLAGAYKFTDRGIVDTKKRV